METLDLSDFPEAILASLGVQAVHPDRFIGDLLKTQLEQVLEALRRGRARHRSPVLSAQEMLVMLDRQGLMTVVRQLQGWIDRF